MTRMIYLVGEPGAGKSTLMAAATDEFVHTEIEPMPLLPAHQLLRAPGRPDEYLAVELGRRRPPFSGTDTLPQTVIEKAINLLGIRPYGDIPVLAEGARLANRRFFDAALERGYDVTLVHVVSDRAAERRDIRAAAAGRPPQNPSWVKGAATAARNLESLDGVLHSWISTDNPGAPDELRTLIWETP